MRTNNIFFDTEFWARGDQLTLISIGLVRVDSDGRQTEFYAENGEFDWDTCDDDWLQANVRLHLIGDYTTMVPAQIGEAVAALVGPNPEFWAYCGAYDWTVLNQACFGAMKDHPSDWLYTFRDIAHLIHAYPEITLPVQDKDSEHNALEDARWVSDVYAAIRARHPAPAPDRRDGNAAGTPGRAAYLGRKT